jgi:hypothetical protein
MMLRKANLMLYSYKSENFGAKLDEKVVLAPKCSKNLKIDAITALDPNLPKNPARCASRAYSQHFS